MMKKIVMSALVTSLLGLASFNLYAAEVCKVSMMGRVCFEEGSPEATAAHMKGDAVAESAKRKIAENETSSKKTAGDDTSAKKVAAK